VAYLIILSLLVDVPFSTKDISSGKPIETIFINMLYKNLNHNICKHSQTYLKIVHMAYRLMLDWLLTNGHFELTLDPGVLD